MDIKSITGVEPNDKKLIITLKIAQTNGEKFGTVDMLVGKDDFMKSDVNEILQWSIKPMLNAARQKFAE